jgi:hypothetical protein
VARESSSDSCMGSPKLFKVASHDSIEKNQYF